MSQSLSPPTGTELFNSMSSTFSTSNPKISNLYTALKLEFFKNRQETCCIEILNASLTGQQSGCLGQQQSCSWGQGVEIPIAVVRQILSWGQVVAWSLQGTVATYWCNPPLLWPTCPSGEPPGVSRPSGS